MAYGHQKISLNAGDIVRVTLDKQANVLLLDNTNYSRFRSGRECRYFGGLAKQSPTDIVTPSNGDWNLVVYPGHGGSVNYSTQVIR